MAEYWFRGQTSAHYSAGYDKKGHVDSTADTNAIMETDRSIE